MRVQVGRAGEICLEEIGCLLQLHPHFLERVCCHGHKALIRVCEPR